MNAVEIPFLLIVKSFRIYIAGISFGCVRTLAKEVPG